MLRPAETEPASRTGGGGLREDAAGMPPAAESAHGGRGTPSGSGANTTNTLNTSSSTSPARY